MAKSQRGRVTKEKKESWAKRRSDNGMNEEKRERNGELMSSFSS